MIPGWFDLIGQIKAFNRFCQIIKPSKLIYGRNRTVLVVVCYFWHIFGVTAKPDFGHADRAEVLGIRIKLVQCQIRILQSL